MRLTLRTLLAYLDDVLEPNEAREIGQKLNQSKEAAALVTQIRESIRRRRIGAPELAGPGSGPDPNIVSEYLENVLLPNQVVEFEQLCRNSELHLAEVAACHKILTMVMGQPIEVSDELRERMYELGAMKESALVLATPKGIQPTVSAQMTSGMGSPQVEAFGDRLPEYLTRRTGTGRMWTALMVLLVVGAWIALVVSDESIWTRSPVTGLAKNQSSTEPEGDLTHEISHAQAAASVTGAENAQASVPQSPKKTNTPASNSPNLDSATPTREPISINPPPPADDVVSSATIPKPAMTVSPVTAGDVSNAGAQGSKSTGPVPSSVPQPPSVPPSVSPSVSLNPPAGENQLARSSLTIVTPAELNVIFPKDGDRWLTTRMGEVEPGDSFAVPEPFQGELNFDDDLSVKLYSGSRIQRLPGKAGVDLRIAINRGKVLLLRPETSIHARVVEILLGEYAYRVNFAETGTVWGIEVVLPQPDGLILQGGLKTPWGGMGVTQGELTITPLEQDSVTLDNSRGWLSWTNKNASLNLNAPAPFPAWTRPNELLITPARSQMIKAYEREFKVDVLQSIAPVVTDRRAIISEFATKTMGLTDHILEVVPAMMSAHEESRLAAIVVLREWLAVDPQRVEILRDEMELRSRPEVVEQLINLLWGYSSVDGQSPETSQMLVNLLGNEELAVRELAHFHITRLSGRNYGYHSQAPISERNAAANRWSDFLKREKSLVRPQP